jgi:hypothetical protein
MAVWYNLGSFGIFYPFWYVWTKTNLATPPPSRASAAAAVVVDVGESVRLSGARLGDKVAFGGILKNSGSGHKKIRTILQSFIRASEKTRGRCYDQNVLQFSAKKNRRFSQKPML